MKKFFSIAIGLFAVHVVSAQKLAPDYKKLGELLQPNSKGNKSAYPSDQKDFFKVKDLQDFVALSQKIKENKNLNSSPLENSMPVFVPERMGTMPVYVPKVPKYGQIPNPEM